MGAAFGLASELLLRQPGQLALELPDLLDQTTNESQQLDDDLLGRLSFFLAARCALQRPRVLGAVIMGRLPITPPERGQLGSGDRCGLAGRNHPARVTGQRMRVPLKVKDNYSGGGFAEVLPLLLAT